MKPGLLFSAAVLAMASLPLIAQQVAATGSQSANVPFARIAANQSASVSAHAVPASTHASGTASANAAMWPIKTELVGKLDSKSAKPGDAVIVKTTEKVRTADGTIFPKGSRLVGHVASVQAHGSGQADSTLSLIFDRAELKGGQTLAIHSVIETVAPPANVAAASALDSENAVAMEAPIGGARAGGGGHLGGGLVGGGLGATSSLTTSTTSNLGASTSGAGSTLATTTGAAVHSTADVAGNAIGTAGGAVNGAAGAGASLAAHATGIPGVLLAGDASGSASGTLTASRKNIHLDSGTQIIMGVSGAGER
jgi:hypothetical protein